MSPFSYHALGATVAGMLLGALVSAPLALALYCFGPAGLYAACVLVAVGALAVACALQRRARRVSNEGETN